MSSASRPGAGDHRLTVFTPAAAQPVVAPDTLHVLLVEDSPADAALIGAYLEPAARAVGPSFTVRRVTRLGEARRVLAEAPVDVVLLDLSLPDADRLESLQALLAQAPAVPIVVLTGTADDALALDAVRAGAQDYLVKGREEAHGVRRAVHHAVERQRLLHAAHQASRARDETLAIVSHDLRNALGALEAGVQALRDDEAMTPERLQHTLAIMQRSTAWMDRLIQDLLDVSRLEAGQLTLYPEPVPVNVAVRTLVAVHAAAALERGITLDVQAAPESPWIRADPDRLHQALGNLVANAIKFTPAGGRVTVSTSAPDAGMVRIAVADTGCGMEPGQLAHVFDRFWQARQARRGGAGLGLAIARGILEAHGGTIGVESTTGAGTTFTCALPVSDRPR